MLSIYSTCFMHSGLFKGTTTIATTPQITSPVHLHVVSFDLLVSVDSYNSLQLTNSFLVQPIVFYTQFPSQPTVSNSYPSLLQPHNQSSLLYIVSYLAQFPIVTYSQSLQLQPVSSLTYNLLQFHEIRLVSYSSLYSLPVLSRVFQL